MDTLYMKEELLLDGDAVTAAEQQLRTEAAAERSAGLHPGTMHMVGQSHIDIAWLWPVRETVRKVSRTFSTVCALMDKYPEFRYSQSQPQLYAFAKEHYPQLYGRIKERIAEGRWELVGGMWVEPDLNIPGGESLVRQMLYGQGFYMEEFGKHSTIEWLPDTFGYCASLPQLLKQAGIEYFMTTKLGWNDTNPFPHTLFHWVGIDGTKIVAYQNHGVNEHTHPKDVQEHWQAYDLKEEHEELMLLYGHGDGGGGVTHGCWNMWPAPVSRRASRSADSLRRRHSSQESARASRSFRHGMATSIWSFTGAPSRPMRSISAATARRRSYTVKRRSGVCSRRRIVIRSLYNRRRSGSSW